MNLLGPTLLALLALGLVIYEDAPFTCLFTCRCILKIPPVCIDESKPCCFFSMTFYKGKKGLKKFKIFILRQSGYAFFIIAIRFFVEVWRLPIYRPKPFNKAK